MKTRQRPAGRNIAAHTVLAVAWAAAICVATWKFLPVPAALAAGFFAAAAVFAARFFARDRDSSTASKAGTRRAAVSLAIFLGIPVGAIVLGALLAFFLERHSPFSVAVSLILRDGAETCLSVFALVFLTRSLVMRFRWLAVPEGILALCLASLWLDAHRRTPTQPAWLVDICILGGHDPLVAFRALGLILGSGFLLILFASAATERRGPLTRNRAAAILSLALLVALGAAVFQWAPDLPVAPPPLPPPPQLAALDDPEPPPPPDPVPIAWVEFRHGYSPPARLGGYYFQDRFADRAEELSFAAVSASPPAAELEKAGDESSSPSGPAADSGIPDASQPDGQVITRVHVFRGRDRLPKLIAASAMTAIRVQDPRIGHSWEVRSRAPGFETVADLREDSLRLRLENPAWDETERTRLTALPAESAALQEKAAVLLEGIPAHLSSHAAVKIKRVTAIAGDSFEIPGHNWPGEIDPETGKLESRERARRAAILLRALDVPCRLANGFRYGTGEKEEKRQLLLTDQHETWWPEVYFEETGWLPLVLPVPGEKQDPPQHDLEQLLANSLNTAEADALEETAPAKSATLPLVMTGLGFFAVAALAPALWVLCLAPLFGGPRRRARRLVRAAAGLAKVSGVQRRYGETRAGFAFRAGERSVSEPLARPLATVAAWFEDSKKPGAKRMPSRWETVKWLARIWRAAFVSGGRRIAGGIRNRSGREFGSGLACWGRFLVPFFWRKADYPARDKPFVPRSGPIDPVERFT